MYFVNIMSFSTLMPFYLGSPYQSSTVTSICRTNKPPETTEPHVALGLVSVIAGKVCSYWPGANLWPLDLRLVFYQRSLYGVPLWNLLYLIKTLIVWAWYSIINASPRVIKIPIGPFQHGTENSIDLSTARPKWRLDGLALSGHLLYSLVNHAYASRYHKILISYSELTCLDKRTCIVYSVARKTSN